MSERTLERSLHALSAPDEGDAGLRAWELVGAEFERREPLPRPVPRRSRRAVAALALATACVAAVSIAPSGAVRWVGQRFESRPGVRHAKRVLSSLPAPGSVMVSSRDGLWVVSRDGSKRLLGRYRYPAWSPHGLFVAAVRGHDLVAMEPTGRIHWALPRVPAPRDPSWAPDGFRIAYLSGRDLRVVVGDGSDDHLFARHVAAAPPAWRPGPGHVLAFVHAGHVTVADADLARRLWRSGAVMRPIELAWSPDASRLLAVERDNLWLFDAHGRILKRLRLRRGDVAQAASFSPDGKTIALVRMHAATRLSEVSLLSVLGRAWHPRAGANVSGEFSGVDWSPDGRWLLIAWRDADQWLFVSSADPRRLMAVSNIARAFAAGGSGPVAFPQLRGWCCSG